jgi:hypothetical protein
MRLGESASSVEGLILSIAALRERIVCERPALDSPQLVRSIEALVTQTERAFLLHALDRHLLNIASGHLYLGQGEEALDRVECVVLPRRRY